MARICGTCSVLRRLQGQTQLFCGQLTQHRVAAANLAKIPAAALGMLAQLEQKQRSSDN
jgi:hypothetical protein